MANLHRPTVYQSEWMSDLLLAIGLATLMRILLTRFSGLKRTKNWGIIAVMLTSYCVAVSVFAVVSITTGSWEDLFLFFRDYSPANIVLQFVVPRGRDDVGYEFSDFWRLAQPLQTDVNIDVSEVLAHWVWSYVRAKYRLNKKYDYLLDWERVQVSVFWPSAQSPSLYEYSLFDRNAEEGDPEYLLNQLLESSKFVKAYLCCKFADFYFDHKMTVSQSRTISWTYEVTGIYIY